MKYVQRDERREGEREKGCNGMEVCVGEEEDDEEREKRMRRKSEIEVVLMIESSCLPSDALRLGFTRAVICLSLLLA